MSVKLIYLQHQCRLLGSSVIEFSTRLCDVWCNDSSSILVGLPVSVLFCSGLGTILYLVITGFKVPVYLGSSFAYIAAMQYAISAMDGDVSASIRILLIGLIYVVVAGILKTTGTSG